MGQKIAFMPVLLEGHWVLVDASCVVEVMGALEWLPLPQAGRRLPGVGAWRGRALAVVDLGQVLGLGSAPLTTSPRTLIVRSDAGMLALPISDARAVVWAAREEVRPVHATFLPYMSAEVDDGETVSPILNIAALVADLVPGDDHGPSLRA